MIKDTTPRARRSAVASASDDAREIRVGVGRRLRGVWRRRFDTAFKSGFKSGGRDAARGTVKS
jgi:hypothetical protein